MNNKDLIRQYVSTGLELDSYQIGKLSNNLKRSYFKVRMRNPEFYLDREISLMPEDMQIEALKNSIIKGLKSNYIVPNSEFFENIVKYLGEPSRYNMVYNAMGRDEFIKFCIENGYRTWAKHVEDVDFKLRTNYFTEEQFKKYSELYIEAAMARGYGISTETDILKAGYATIKRFIDDMREKGGLHGSILDREYDIFHKLRLRHLLSTLMKYTEFNQLLTAKDLAWILLTLNDKDGDIILDIYFSKGGSMERIKNTMGEGQLKNYIEAVLDRYQSKK